MEIRLLPDEARSHAQDVIGSRADAFDILTQLRGRMDNLASSFSGKTHDAFMARLDEWKTSSDDLLEALQSLGEFLNTAADTLEDTDTQLSQQLGG